MLEHDSLASSEQQREIRELNRLGHKLRRPRDIVAGFDFNTQADIALFALSRTIGDTQAKIMLQKQLGNETLQLSPADYEDLPPRAQERVIESFSKRAENSWPFLLLEPEMLQYCLPNQVSIEGYMAEKEQFQQTYLHLAEQLGLFPFEPQFEAIPSQRLIDFRTRVLAAKLMFVDSVRQYRNFQTAGAPLVTMISQATSAYGQREVSELQQMVARKGKLSPERQASLEKHGLWQETEALSYMCADRGLRDAIIDFYGIFRDVRVPPGSGYLVGQNVYATNPVLRNSLRVAAKEE